MKKPDYRIIVNGQNITPKLQGRLISLTLTDERSETADQLDIALDDHDGGLAIPPRNATIEVWIGYTGELTHKGSFTLDEISHTGTPDTLVLRARSVDFKGSLKTKREQSWHDLSLADLLTTIASRNGLIPAIAAELGAKTVQHIDQTNESDISLIQRLGKHYGALATVKAGRLLFAPAGNGRTAGGSDIPRLLINRQQGDQHEYSINDRDSDYTGVQANWNDRKYAALKHIVAGEPGNLKMIRHTYRNAADATEAAAAEWRKLNRNQASFTLTLAQGNAQIYPQTPVGLVGYKAEITAIDWIAARVVHALDESGFTTRVELEVSEDTDPAQ